MIEDNTHEIDLESSSDHLSRAAFFSILKTYGVIPINLITTYIVSRTLDENIWGIVLYSLALIAASQSILAFFPPSFDSFVTYKIPEYIIQGKKGKAKGILLYGIRIKLIVGFFLMIIYIVIAIGLFDSKVSYAISLLIFLPKIFIGSISHVFASFLKALKRYKAFAIFNILNNSLILVGVLFLYSLSYDQTTSMYIYAFVNVIGFLPSLTYKIIIIGRYFRGTKTEKVEWAQIKKSIKFGLYYSVSGAFSQGYNQAYLGFINYYGTPDFIVYNNICKNIINQARGAFALPTSAIYSDLEQTDQRKKLVTLFKQQIKLVNILICFIMGALFFFIRIYILVLYPPEYLEVVQVFQIFVFIIYFRIVLSNYLTIFSVTGMERYIAVLDGIASVFMALIAFLGMYYFSFIGIVTSQLIGYVFWTTLYWYFANKKLKKVKISIAFLYRQLVELVGILVIVRYFFQNLLLSIVPLNWLNSFVLGIMNLIAPSSLDLTSQVSIIVENGLTSIFYVVVFLIYIIVFRVLTKQDLKRLKKLKFRFPLKDSIFSILSRILRSEKKERKQEKKRLELDVKQ